jgi:oxygen-dependent protoporphyrinogen oxidase
VLTSPLLSIAGKLRLLAEPFVPPRSGMEHEARKKEKETQWLHAPFSLLPAPCSLLQGHDESVASFVRRRLGRQVYDRLVQPLVAGIYTGDAENLSMAATMPQFLAHERQFGSLLRASLRLHMSRGDSAFRIPHSASDSTSGARYGAFVAPRGGMSSLVAAIAARLPPDAVRLGTQVRQIRRAAMGRWQVELQAPPARELFDALVIALPSHAAADILKSQDANLAAELAAIRYAGCAVVSAGFRRDQIAHPLDGFGFVVPRIEDRRIVAASFASNKFPGRAPQQGVLIRTFVGGSLQPELAELPDQELRRLVLDELAELLSITGLPQWIDIARWPQSMPQYQVGHLARVARIERLSARWPGLALAGNAYDGVGIPQCIASGERAAERLAAALHSPTILVGPRNVT